ncbi:MAG TPA: hypothetical protein DCL77_01615 [Prolixibacteraceae bacterium]|jgi:hypothetical protein|nr:hypothetical protein [Prolixibacteraceae bacterium]
MKNLVCPISDQRVNEYVTRINALLTLILVVLAFVLNSVFLLVFLMADFFIRAFTEIKFSPISYTSYYLSNTLSLSVRMIDKAPKIFAARLGFLMTAVIAGLFILNLPLAAMVVAGILIFFAALEFIFAICVGCMIYTYLVLPFYKK